METLLIALATVGIFVFIGILARIPGWIKNSKTKTEEKPNNEDEINSKNEESQPKEIKIVTNINLRNDESINHFPVVGLQYRNLIEKDRAKLLKKEEQLLFEIEENNTLTGKTALRVTTNDNILLGYVQSPYSRELIELLKGGKNCRIYVDNLEYKDDDLYLIWSNVTIDDETPIHYNTVYGNYVAPKDVTEETKDFDFPEKTEFNGKKITLVKRKVTKDTIGKTGTYDVEEEYIYEDGGTLKSIYFFNPLSNRLEKAQMLESDELIDDAIKEYEELIKLNFSYVPFKRLCILYKKANKIDDEIRVAKKWLEYEKENVGKFMPLKGILEAENRLNKAQAKKSKIK